MAQEGNTGTISLPNGGGAISGLGEKFSPDLFTGSGNFSVPITLPPGRNGFQPQLNLEYSTGSGNGPFGLGWSLGIPGVGRKTSKGIPKYQGRDTFILSGSEDLVPVKTEANITKYRPRTEGLFARIERINDAENDYWNVRSKDGLASKYGTSKSKGNDPAAIAHPNNRNNVFAWKLTETKDTFGNRIVYSYLRDSGDTYDQLYPEEIRYVDYKDESGNEKFLVTVRFAYDDIPIRYEDAMLDNRRIYPTSDHRAGFEIRTAKICSAIKIYTNPDGVETLTDNQLTRSYKMVYLHELPDAELQTSNTKLPKNGIPLLHRIEVIGHDGGKTETLPAPRFGYSTFDPKKRKFFPVEGRDIPSQSLADPNLELVDLFGNGLPDLLETKGDVRYWRNLGNGKFDMPREMREAPTSINLAANGVQILDANGDGRPDLMVTTPEMSGYFPTRPDALWDRRSFQRYRQSPSFSLQDPEVRLIDLDGDGVSDVLRSGSRFELFYNDPEQGWNEVKQVSRGKLEDFPNVNFSDVRVKWADMTGDGLTDIVLVHDGNIEYWPNKGYGNWGKRIHMHDSPRLPYGYDPQQIFFGDLNGDGAADLIYVDHCKVTLWVNQAGRGWSDAIEIDGTPPITYPSAIRLVDLNGSGTSALLWTSDKRGARNHYYYLDFTGGIKPYLLTTMDNRIGALTRVTYESSTRFYVEDEKRSETRWQSTLPFPVQVVNKVEVIDRISKGKLTTEYSYHHGYWDGEEREFRGFGRVDQRDTESFETYHQQSIDEDLSFQMVDQQYFSPPTETRTWFHQGPIKRKDGDWITSDYQKEYWQGDLSKLDWVDKLSDFLKALDPKNRRDALRTLRGSTLRSEMYALDGNDLEERPYTVSESVYGVREESPPDPEDTSRRRIYLPHQLASRTTQWERGDEPMTQFSFTSGYDQYGQPTETLQIACPRNWLDLVDTSQKYLATFSKSIFAVRDDADEYIVDRVADSKSYEINPDTAVSVRQLKDSVQDGSVDKRLIGHSLTFYDGQAYIGLENGTIGEHGAAMRTETLVFTEEILKNIHNGVLPPYFKMDGQQDFGNEYPTNFIDALSPSSATNPARPGLINTLLGYGLSDGITSPFEKGFYVAGQRQEIDDVGLPISTIDALGNKTTLEYDNFGLFPIKTTDPAGLETHAEYNYHFMQPTGITDANGNRSAVSFTPLGMTKSLQVMGKADEEKGDRPEQPGTRFEYDFFAFEKSMQTDPDHPHPVFVHTIQRTEHAWDLIEQENMRRTDNGEDSMIEAEIDDFFTDEAENHPERFIETREYSDGFGRVIQNRVQAEDVLFGDEFFGNGTLPENQDDQAGTRKAVVGKTARNTTNVSVSGWQTFNNKGKPIEQYEPFYHQGWDYLDRSEASDEMVGQTATLFYDPRGQVLRTVNPNGSEQRVIYGIPEDFDDPDNFKPTPWEAYTYDTNDNAGRTHATESQDYQAHWNSPANIEIDALGRTVKAIERTRDSANDPMEEIATKSRYDILGNLLEVTDAFDRKAFKYIYSLVPESQPLNIESIDAGLRQVIVNAAGQEVERRDGKGSLILQNQDALQRPTHFWARDDVEQEVKLRQKLIYGDNPDANLTPGEIEDGNFLGQLYQHYDEAGRITIGGYDFKGNPLETTRQVIADGQLLSVYADAPANDWKIESFQVDWQQSEPNLLNSKKYKTTSNFDALNRPTEVIYPEDVEGNRSRLNPVYNRAGALEQVKSGAKTYVDRIAYNAKGQRTMIAYGNGLMTRYAYDEKAFRLKRLRTENYTQPDNLTYKPNGSPVQDFAYSYDLSGNILKIKDRISGSGTAENPDKLDRLFTYDPLYRLRSATGRECKQDLPNPPWLDNPKCQDTSQTRGYMREYNYDAMGNMQQMKHHALGSSGFQTNRTFTAETANNRLKKVDFGGTAFDYGYDVNGNMVQEGQARHFEWNHSDQLKAFRTQANNSEPSVHAQYLYDATGQRVMKLVRKQGGKLEARVFIGELFEHYLWDMETNIPKENSVLHVMDDQQRIALVRRGAAHPDDRGPDIQFHLGDHLGSSNLVVDDNGSFMNREEHYPYGETSFGSFGKKRYRFTGKERDEESGLSYHGARYYANMIFRWISTDRTGATDGNNLYIYVLDNPISFHDPTGNYMEAGHFYTVYFVALSAGFPEDVAFKTAFYAQMPDEVHELDATATMISAVKLQFVEHLVTGQTSDSLSPSPQLSSDATAHAQLIQRNLHVLTGGSATLARKNIASKLKNFEPGTPIFGMLLHAFGDSYTHTVPGTDNQFSTGKGHAFEGNKPDQINLRQGIYLKYTSSLYDSLIEIAKNNGWQPRISKSDLTKFTTHISNQESETSQIRTIRGISAMRGMGGPMRDYSPENENHFSKTMTKTSFDDFKKENFYMMKGVHLDQLINEIKTNMQPASQ
ncbi:SpvB/TcaC N-terminal domain-containing protein [Pricia sp. S334]|uniref:SpvB/TcaC N-terminal domain-containing protein n=1 Tax=Pricia mediterranea TaxID=3076079 RepID=A0ABU3L1I3_9FLAO|nr:SpvB/TcaC N-terminal domain-containing protein [Pricia sp. S334]MDT7827138.1 SpvB/TcaC N-terminal domain-containing protein [Pricia sp. S334]